MRLSSVLKDSRVPLLKRVRALFALKSIGGEDVVAAISGTIPHSSALLKHELAYCLGQMRNVSALPHLVQLLEDTTEDPMPRHEAAEALGALGDVSCVAVLSRFLSDSEQTVRETCQIALDRITYQTGVPNELLSNEFGSIDPAPAAPSDLPTSLLAQQLMDSGLSLYQRYRAMFALRNRGDPESVMALCSGFGEPHSALFRHEIAFVLGQLASPLSVPALSAALSRHDEVTMVRHETAEALGAIGTPECIEMLRKHVGDKDDVVRESCEVGLDIAVQEKKSDACDDKEAKEVCQREA